MVVIEEWCMASHFLTSVFLAIWYMILQPCDVHLLSWLIPGFVFRLRDKGGIRYYGGSWNLNNICQALMMIDGAALADAGHCFNIKTGFPGMGMSCIKIRWWWDCLIFIMGILTLARWHFYITGPCFNIKTVFPGMGISDIKIRWWGDHLIFIMGIIKLGKMTFLYQRAQFQYKDWFSRYGDFCYKDKIVVRPSYLYNRNTHTGKMTFLYGDDQLEDSPWPLLWTEINWE